MKLKKYLNNEKNSLILYICKRNYNNNNSHNIHCSDNNNDNSNNDNNNNNNNDNDIINNINNTTKILPTWVTFDENNKFKLEDNDLQETFVKGGGHLIL